MYDLNETHITDNLQTILIFHIQLVGIFIIYLHNKHSQIQTININYNNNRCIMMIHYRNFVHAIFFSVENFGYINFKYTYLSVSTCDISIRIYSYTNCCL